MLHLIKLSVGSDSVMSLLQWQNEKLLERVRNGGEHALYHFTRSTPRRRDALLDGGSIYWVIAGKIRLRQQLIDIRNTECEGIKQCQLVFSPIGIRTETFPFRPFQGWRYLEAEKAPPDLQDTITKNETEHISLKNELKILGLID